MPPYKHRSDTALRLSSRERPGTISGRKYEMCLIFNLYDTSVFVEGSKDYVQRKERSSD